MRIGFVSTYPPIECGIATYTSYLRDELTKQGNETFVVSSIGAAGKNVFSVYTVNEKGFGSLIYDTSIKLTPDLMHIQHEFGLYGQNNKLQIIELILRYKLTGIPVVTTFHTVKDMATAEENLIQRIMLSESSAVIVHDDSQKKLLVERFGMAEKIHVVPHGVREVSTIVDAKKKLKVEGKKVILLCGYFRPIKRFDKIVKLMPEITRQDENAILVIAGKTRRIKCFGNLFQLVNKSPVKEKIIVLCGQFPQHTFDVIISAADLIVLPYEAGAQSGIMAQCYAFHKPIVTSNLPAFKKETKKIGTGLVCETDEDYVKNIIKIFSDDQFRLSLVKNISNYIEKEAGWSKVASAHSVIYQSLVKFPYSGAKHTYFPEEDAS